MTRELTDISAFSALEERIGYRFSDPALLERALSHTSWVNESSDPAARSNETLEFLGDAVLELGVSALLYERCETETAAGDGLPPTDRPPLNSEGVMTALRARLVCTESLASLARRLGLGAFLRLGVGAERGGERENASVLEDAFEALLGAVYLDGGEEAASRTVRRLFASEVEAQAAQLSGGGSVYDYKTLLQIRLQENGPIEIRYEMVSEEGPDHDKTFMVRVSANGVPLGEGSGRTKKAAEQAAAQAALGKR
ncbi:MAG: ribonuclease III [Clostridiales bacterium]|nr:ribonuclease III [Clostridiales bacterium]